MRHFIHKLLTSPAGLLPVLALLLIAPLALAQYRQALPGYTFQFPRDHAAHPEFKTEWWYYTGHLQAADGRQFGYELTFFRVGTDADIARRADQSGPWRADQVFPAHFAVSDIGNRRFHFAEKLNRAGLQVAGARSDIYYVWNELWSAKLLGDRQVLTADDPVSGHEIHLMLTPEKPPVIHGTNGVSQKADCTGCASHYYSQTRLRTEGFLMANGQAIPVTGISWMDHEFGSNQLGKNQVGWDWFSLQLDNGRELMIYLLRLEDGRLDPNSSGTLVETDGRNRHLRLAEFQVEHVGRTWTSPQTQARYPLGWRITVPGERIDLTVTPAFEAQELATTGSTGVAYWEGASTVQGRWGIQAVRGQAYVELTGYAEPFRQRI